jgi:hypothetical protein
MINSLNPICRAGAPPAVINVATDAVALQFIERREHYPKKRGSARANYGQFPAAGCCIILVAAATRKEGQGEIYGK